MRLKTFALLALACFLPALWAAGASAQAPPAPADSPVLSIDPSIAHEGDQVTLVASGCTEQVRFVVTAADGTTLVDDLEPAGSSRFVFMVPAGTAGTSLAVSASCVAPDGTVTITYPPGDVSVVGAGADATIVADPTTVTAGSVTTISGTGCLFGGTPGVVDLFALGQSFSFPASADGSWTDTVDAPPGTPPGTSLVNTRCRAFGGSASFEYADISLEVRSLGGTASTPAAPAAAATAPAPGSSGSDAAPAAPSPGSPGPAVVQAPIQASSSTGSAPAVSAAPATPVPSVADYVG